MVKRPNVYQALAASVTAEPSSLHYKQQLIYAVQNCYVSWES